MSVSGLNVLAFRNGAGAGKEEPEQTVRLRP
jgi:hypothetical protein